MKLTRKGEEAMMAINLRHSELGRGQISAAQSYAAAPYYVADCIEEARKSLAGRKLVHLEPDDGDDCVIREIWM